MEVSSNRLITIINEEDIKYLQEVFNKDAKVPGITDMAKPQYKIKLGKKGDVYFLWFNDEMETGTIMNAEDTHTIYTI